MSGRPVLSVVMPVHNPAQYLVPCLESVLGQTFHDFELIAIDDGSSDGSLETLRSYAARDARMTALANEANLGAARTRNRGLDLARGEYVIFLDADDFFDRTYFAEMMLLARQTSADVTIAPLWWRDELTKKEWVTPEDADRLAHVLSGSVRPEEHPFEMFRIPCVPFNKIIRRSFLLEMGIRFQDISNNNDTYFGMMVVAVARRVAYLPTPHIHYRTHTGCQISTHRGKHPECVWVAFQKVHDELQARGRWEDFRQAYYQALLGSVLWTAEMAENPTAFLSYVHGEGAACLGLQGLARQDFDSYRTYGKYQVVMHGGDIAPEGFLSCAKRLLAAACCGEMAATYWLLGHTAKRAARGVLGRA